MLTRHRRKTLLLFDDSAAPSYAASTLSATSVVAADGSTTVAYTATVRRDGVAEVGKTGVSASAVAWEPLATILAGSFVSVSDPFITSDGVDAVTITVQLGGYYDGEWFPLVGVAAADIGVAVSGTNNTIAALSGVTSASGVITTTFTTTQASTVKTISGTLFGGALTATATCESDGTGGAAPSPGDPFFEDSFAGPGFNPANGWTWDTSDQVTAVTFDGGPAARVNYNTSTGSGTLRWNMGQYLEEVWFEFDLHVPANFAHPNTGPNNNKLFVLWRDTYSDATNGTTQVAWEYQTDGATTPNSTVRVMARRWDYNTVESSGYTGITGQYGALIGGTGPIAIDGWSQIRIHIKAASAYGASDGVQQMWVDGVLHTSTTTARLWNYPTGTDPVDTLFRNGYMMGSANGQFTDPAGTNFHVRAWKAYNTDPGW